MKLISFDYIYYRLYQFYFKWDGRKGITAAIGIAMIQAVLICDMIVLLLRIAYTRIELMPYSKLIGYSGGGLAVLLILYNYLKYQKKFSLLNKKWKNESPAIRKKNGFYVIFALILPWIPLIIFGLIL